MNALGKALLMCEYVKVRHLFQSPASLFRTARGAVVVCHALNTSTCNSHDGTLSVTGPVNEAPCSSPEMPTWWQPSLVSSHCPSHPPCQVTQASLQNPCGVRTSDRQAAGGA